MSASTFAQELEDLLRTGDQLPTLPHVVFELYGVLNDDMAGTGDVAAVIERDPALTARLLRAANSAAFVRGPQQRVGSVLAAIGRLGVNQVRAICLVLSVVNAFGGRRRGLGHEAFWAHSAAVGMVAKLIYARARPDGHMSLEDMYVAGLLHDLGLLILDQFFPEHYDRIAAARSDADESLWTTEQRLLGMTHAEVGGALLERWGLPGSVVRAVSCHHKPELAPPDSARAAWVVAAAEAFCGTQQWALVEEGRPQYTPEAAFAGLGLPDSLVDELLIELAPVGEQAQGVLG
ncbi:MAG TPA: HDOD domain-containing protein [Gemmatimonadales bacterium]|nr:HDOD domain-containing protein [Gemmatimonadales bacterium]